MCDVQLCMASRANEMIFNGCFVLRELTRRDTTGVHDDDDDDDRTPVQKPMATALWVCAPTAKVPREKLFVSVHLVGRSVGRFSEANDKSLFPNPFNIYTSVMLTRRRCHTAISRLLCLHLDVMCLCKA